MRTNKFFALFFCLCMGLATFTSCEKVEKIISKLINGSVHYEELSQLYYQINTDDLSAMVVSPKLAENVTKAYSAADGYNGAINIPATITIDGTTLTVNGIGEAAFEGSSITSVTIDAKTVEIMANAFKDCDQLKSIVSYCSSVMNIADGAIPENITVSVPTELVEQYESTYPDLIIEEAPEKGTEKEEIVVPNIPIVAYYGETGNMSFTLNNDLKIMAMNSDIEDGMSVVITSENPFKIEGGDKVATDFTFNANGFVTSFVETYQYDTTADQTTVKYEIRYDNKGHMISCKSIYNSPNGEFVDKDYKYTYDAQGRLITISYGNEKSQTVVTYSYLAGEDALKNVLNIPNLSDSYEGGMYSRVPETLSLLAWSGRLGVFSSVFPSAKTVTMTESRVVEGSDGTVISDTGSDVFEYTYNYNISIESGEEGRLFYYSEEQVFEDGAYEEIINISGFEYADMIEDPTGRP